MTWKIFIGAIKESEIENGNEAQILIKLFQKAGYINRKEDGISESTAKKWIDGSRNCKVSSYFPDKDNVNTEQVYSFFRGRPEDKLKKLQQIFLKTKDVNSPIEYETKNMDLFCGSLVNQFLDLLKFEREDLSNICQKVDCSFDGEHKKSDVTDISSDEKKNISQNLEQAEHILDIFDRSFQDFGIQDFLEVDPFKSMRSFRIEDAVYFIGRIKTNLEKKSETALGIDGEKLCENIISFTEILLEYIKYLKDNMREEIEDDQPKYFVCDRVSEDEFKNKTGIYRQQLKSLYSEIDAASEKVADKHLEELRILQKKSWDENTRTGLI